MKKRPELPQHGNLIAMIDVVFQLVIFFVCTAKLQDNAFDEKVKLAMAPHGKAVEKKDPREIYIEVDARGRIVISRTEITPGFLTKLMRKAVAEYGQSTPVIIRGDLHTKHEDIRRVMDACTAAGIWKVSFAALRESAGAASAKKTH